MNKVLGEDNVIVIKTAIQKAKIGVDDLTIIARKMGGIVYGLSIRNIKADKPDAIISYHSVADLWGVQTCFMQSCACQNHYTMLLLPVMTMGSKLTV